VLDEDPAEFEAFADELRRDLRPATATQRVLVERIIFVSWKLRRIPAIEAEHVEQCKDFVSSWRSLDPQRLTATQVLSHEACQAYFARLQMYEMRLERSLHACLRQLERLKKMQNEASAEEPQIEERSEQNEATEGSETAKSTRDTDVSSVPWASDVEEPTATRASAPHAASKLAG
jgi:hypothetical protein